MESEKLLDVSYFLNNDNRAVEKLTMIELQSVTGKTTSSRAVQMTGSVEGMQETFVKTPYGDILVAVQGNTRKPAIVTFHDIGLNYVTCFQGFFNFEFTLPLLRHFAIYHINAPGQEEKAEDIGPNKTYPTMDQLTEVVDLVLDHFSLKRILGFGVGAGANILMRFALQNSNRINGLVLVNPTTSTCGWIEWGYQKMNSWYLFGGQMTNFTEEYLLWHWFGQKTRWRNHDLVAVYKTYMKRMNNHNLSLFINAYIKRSDLTLSKEGDVHKRGGNRHLKGRVLLLVGDDSPHIDNVVEMNGRMDPHETDFMKIQDCGGMPLEEQPGKVCEALKLFLQGMGYIPTLRHQNSVVSQLIHNIHDLKMDSSHKPEPAMCKSELKNSQSGSTHPQSVAVDRQSGVPSSQHVSDNKQSGLAHQRSDIADSRMETAETPSDETHLLSETEPV